MSEITVEVVGAESVQLRLASLADEVRARVAAKVTRLGLELLRKVKTEYLRGPRPERLGVKSGRLSRSVNEQTTADGDRIESAVGTAVTYGRFWELGFRGTEQVKAHMRTTDTVFGRKFATPVQMVVRAHSRRVNQAGRPFLVPALDEMRARVVEQLTAATQGGG